MRVRTSSSSQTGSNPEAAEEATKWGNAGDEALRLKSADVRMAGLGQAWG